MSNKKQQPKGRVRESEQSNVYSPEEVKFLKKSSTEEEKEF
ncbi:hypothetical protein V6C27_00945 [Peptococcaceae bacterium 1198_IL3148]